MERMLKILHAENPAVLTMLANAVDPEDELNYYVKNDPSKLRGSLKIDDGIFVERNTSTNTKINFLKKLFRAYGTDSSNLVFYLYDTSNTTLKSDEEGTRFELRRRYWTLALEYIKKAFG